MCDAIDMALFVLNKYYRLSKAVPAYAAAVLLDPSKRKQYMRKSWEPAAMQQAIGQVQMIWEAKYKNLPIPDKPQQHQTPRRRGKKREVSVFDAIRAEIDVASEPKIQDDFLSFINTTPVALHDLKPIQWWCLEAQRTRYPRLHQMALDILSIPPMSDQPERTFSCARRTVSWSRAKLNATSINMVELLANWVSQGFISPGQGMEELLAALCDADIDSDSSDEGE